MSSLNALRLEFVGEPLLPAPKVPHKNFGEKFHVEYLYLQMGKQLSIAELVNGNEKYADEIYQIMDNSDTKPQYIDDVGKHDDAISTVLLGPSVCASFREPEDRTGQAVVKGL